ncbi:CoA transferase [uncultured Roseovarius sp.]|uniref:CaiB/BaiF CoA transferase family protein n=1 Tax=uncultured Roseovarius sp. TaxID=293344 RepID=UPI002612E71B|nr:CoA transferase [uncultured Roseovarius sp.]
MTGALSGIRVVELSQVLAAPFCGYQFALLGAEVIKVELPDAPDCARGRGPLPELNARGIGVNYQVQGGNKRALALDFRSKAGRAALLKLAESADVFLENYTTGAMESFGLGYEALRQCNPRLVYCSMTGYGDQGPKASKGAYDNTIQAASGTIGQCNGVKPGLSFVDYAAGYSAAFAISAALLQRERTGEGCYISVSMLEVALSLMAPEAASTQAAPEAEKHKEAGISAYETADGRLMLGAFKPSQYRKLGTCLTGQGYDVGLLEQIHDWPDVWQHSAAIREDLQAIFAQRPAEEWQILLEAAGVPAECIVSLAEAVTAPQLAARGYFAPSPADPSLRLPLAGFRMTEGGAALHSAPPELGQDSRAVLAGAGLSGGEIEALFAEGIAK